MWSRGSKEERHVANHTGVPTGHHIRGPGRELRRLLVTKGVSRQWQHRLDERCQEKDITKLLRGHSQNLSHSEEGGCLWVWAGAEPRPAGAVEGQCMLLGGPVYPVV